MISTSGKYWSTGITVAFMANSGRGPGDAVWSGWGASLDFHDDGFVNDAPDGSVVSTEGTLRTRYAVRGADTKDALYNAVEALIVDAARLGIEFKDAATVYYRGDGEHAAYPPPDGWREMVNAVAASIPGFVPCYRIVGAE